MLHRICNHKYELVAEGNSDLWSDHHKSKASQTKIKLEVWACFQWRDPITGDERKEAGRGVNQDKVTHAARKPELYKTL